MRAVVTGAGGMLGQALVPALKSAGHATLALTRSDADVTQPEQLQRAFESFRPDWVFHLAAFTRVNDCEARPEYATQVNGHGAGNAARAAASVGAAVMMISTDYVFSGKAKGEPYIESAEPEPCNAYGYSKLEGERQTIQSNKKHLIVRTAWLYGEGGRNFPDTILTKAERGEPLRVVDDQVGSPTWTKDLARALTRLAEVGEFGIFHCTSSGECNWYQFAQFLLPLAGWELHVEAIKSSDASPAVARPQYSVLCNRKFEQTAGYRMPRWEDAAKRYLDSIAVSRRTRESQ